MRVRLRCFCMEPWKKLTAHLTAWSSSASSKIKSADFPPVSRVIFFMLMEAIFMISLPVVVLPVNAILSTSKWLASAFPASLPCPLIILITPGGNPASLNKLAMYKIDSGVCSAALSTTVLPHANAGPNFHAAISSGKFHGMIWPQTPTGSLIVYASLSAPTSMVWPWFLSA